MKRRTQLYTIIAILLLGQMSELLPSLHHHEEQHHCIELGGAYFEVAEEGSDGFASSLPTVRGLRADKDHHHQICALCQLAPFYLDAVVVPWALSLTKTIGTAWRNESRSTDCQAGRFARGPPIC